MQRALTSLFSTLSLVTFGCLIPLTAEAQITPDGTTSTTVNQAGNDFTIEQGSRVGDNLFHSFDEFSVPTLGSAFFNNAGDIANIFSRVTGSNISIIDGLLSANGAANLFLINPNGIIFGENASLNLGGSFYGSTADSILFPNDVEFSANGLNTPLLTINIPIGLDFRDNPGSIEVKQKPDSNLFASPHLALIGGEVSLDGGRVFGGNITLGGLADAGTVNLNEDGSLSFPDNVTKADVSLTNGAFLGIFGSQGNSIDINAKNVTFTGNSFAIVGTGNDINIQADRNVSLDGNSFIIAQVSEDSEGDTGDINIQADHNLSLDGNSFIIAQVLERAKGNTGYISIQADRNVSLDGKSFIIAQVLGKGDAGDIDIDVGAQMTVDDSFILAQVLGKGDAGDVIITTGNLNLSNGGRVDGKLFGQGNAGSVKITASDTITIEGDGEDYQSSWVVSEVFFNAIGDAGDVIIKTSNLNVTNGGLVSVNTLGQGNAGSVEITANNLDLTKGGLVAANTFGQGNAGSIEITATDTITIDGELPAGDRLPSAAASAAFGFGDAGDVIITTNNLNLTNGGLVITSTFGQGDAGSVELTASDTITIDGELSNGDPSAATSRVEPGAIGNAGDVSLTTSNLNLTNGGSVVASTSGQGNAGSITVEANSISLNNNAKIDAFTQSGEGGIISLQITEDLTLRSNSLISSLALGNADGGNVKINASDGFIIAFPNGNNDILASAEQGDGGNINITALSLFGIEERPQNPITNDIDASSEFGLQGNFSLNTPDFDPTSGLIELPEAVVDATDQISQNICEQGVGSEFIITGKGGLPPNPHETLNSDEEQVDLVEPVPLQRETVGANGIRPNRIRLNNLRPEKSTAELVPAQGWIFNDKGEVTLTSYKTPNTEINTSPQQKFDGCSNSTFENR